MGRSSTSIGEPIEEVEGRVLIEKIATCPDPRQRRCTSGVHRVFRGDG